MGGYNRELNAATSPELTSHVENCDQLTYYSMIFYVINQT